MILGFINIPGGERRISAINSSYKPQNCLRGGLLIQKIHEYLNSVFFCVVAPIHWETDLREAYASLRGVKGSLRGGVLFRVAYAGGYARIFCQQV